MPSTTTVPQKLTTVDQYKTFLDKYDTFLLDCDGNPFVTFTSHFALFTFLTLNILVKKVRYDSQL